MGKINIRKLKDIDSDYKYLTEWYKEEPIYTVFEQRILSYEEIKKKYYPRTLRNAKVPVYMIEYDKEPVGIIQYTLIGNEDKELYKLKEDKIYEMDIFIGNLNLHHKGIGTRAINILVNKLFKEKNADLVVMCPLKTNEKAINCYKKCGFTIKGGFDTQDTIGDMQSYVLMVKDN